MFVVEVLHHGPCHADVTLGDKLERPWPARRQLPSLDEHWKVMAYGRLVLGIQTYITGADIWLVRSTLWVRQLWLWHSQYMEKKCSEPPTKYKSLDIIKHHEKNKNKLLLDWWPIRSMGKKQRMFWSWHMWWNGKTRQKQPLKWQCSWRSKMPFSVKKKWGLNNQCWCYENLSRNGGITPNWMYEMTNIYGLKHQVVNFEQDLVYDWVQHISYHQLGMSRNAGVYPMNLGINSYGDPWKRWRGRGWLAIEMGVILPFK